MRKKYQFYYYFNINYYFFKNKKEILKEKEEDNKKSQNLKLIIEKLNEQKQLLSLRLQSEKQVQFNNASHNLLYSLFEKKQGEKIKWEHFHFKNIGILHVK